MRLSLLNCMLGIAQKNFSKQEDRSTEISKLKGKDQKV